MAQFEPRDWLDETERAIYGVHETALHRSRKTAKTAMRELRVLRGRARKRAAYKPKKDRSE